MLTLALRAMVIVGFAWPTLAGAQLLRGRVTEELSGAPVAGALVTLLDAQGSRLATALTTEDGRFALRAPQGSAVTVEVKRIGLARARRPIEALGSGESRDVELTVAAVPAVQPRVEISGKTSCGRVPGETQQVGALWEDLLAALTATRLTYQQRLLNARIAKFKRRLDANGNRVMEEQREEQEGIWEQPFRSARPEMLSRDGYVVQVSDTLVYHAPDATTLLSEEFIEEHCFRLVAGKRDDRGLVGIAFEPTRSRRVPDVEGVLWMDAESRQLRRVDYTYTLLPVDDRADRFGGRVEFTRMSQGSWIVSRWWIRMPVIGRASHARAVLPGQAHNPNAPVVTGMREEGGEVLSATPVRSSGQ